MTSEAKNAALGLANYKPLDERRRTELKRKMKRSFLLIAPYLISPCECRFANVRTAFRNSIDRLSDLRAAHSRLNALVTRGPHNPGLASHPSESGLRPWLGARGLFKRVARRSATDGKQLADPTLPLSELWGHVRA